MAFKKERGSNKSKGLCKLAFDKEITIYTIDELKQGITKELSSYKRFELNLANVEEIDSAGIQLLLAFRSELKRENKTFKLTAASDPVVELIESYNIGDRLNLGDVA